MNKKIIEDLVELGIYKEKFISKEQYEEQSSNSDDSHIYTTGYYGESDVAWHKVLDTNGLTMDEVKLMLELDRTKNIRSIKSMVKFFVVLTVIGMILAFMIALGM